MILCHCAAVTDRTIASLIEEGARTVVEITRRCGAGRCCASCREEIASMLYSTAETSHIRATARQNEVCASSSELR